MLFAVSALRHLWNLAIDPLHGDGYQWWSGLGSDLMYFTGLWIFLRHHNCHVRGCMRPGHMYQDINEMRCNKHRPQPKE